MVENKIQLFEIDFVNQFVGPKVTCISKKNANPVAITFEMKMSKVKDE